jgi:hypothetical protein
MFYSYFKKNDGQILSLILINIYINAKKMSFKYINRNNYDYKSIVEFDIR